MIVVTCLHHGLDLVELLIGANTLVGLDSLVSRTLTEEAFIDLCLLSLVLDFERLAVDGLCRFLSWHKEVTFMLRINFINYSFIRQANLLLAVNDGISQ